MKRFIKIVIASLPFIFSLSCIKTGPLPLAPEFDGEPSVSVSGTNIILSARLGGTSVPSYHDCGFYLNDGKSNQIIKASISGNGFSSFVPAKDYAGMRIKVNAFITNGLGNEILSSSASYSVPAIATKLSLPEETRIMEGEKMRLQLTMNSSGALNEIEWKSDNVKVAEVDDKGYLTGIGMGVTVVSAKLKVSGLIASTKVYVGGNYIDWIGDWKVNRGGYTDTWHVAMGEYGSTYMVTGIEGEEYEVVAEYNKDKTLSISGDQIVGMVAKSGEQYAVHLHAEVDYSGTTYWCNSGRDYQIFKAQIGSSGNASVVPQTFNGKNTGVQTIKRFRYRYTKSSSLECADTHYQLNSVATELPCTMTAVKPSTSSVSTVLAGNDGTMYQVRGRCKDISNTTYGNWYLDDGTGRIYIYGTLSRYGRVYWESLGISEGDMVTVKGYRKTYNTNVELGSVIVVKIEK